MISVVAKLGSQALRVPAESGACLLFRERRNATSLATALLTRV